MKILFLLLLIIALNILYGTEGKSDDVLPERLREATLIVGSTRIPGGVPEPISSLIGDGDLSHTTSFPGSKVVSVDLRSCFGDWPHIRGDFLTLPFCKNSQLRVVFEWFPSHCRVSSVPPSSPYIGFKPIYHNYKPMLLPALYKAFEVLTPGGELIIDHLPYSIRLSSDCDQAIETLTKYGVPPEVIASEIEINLPADGRSYPGIVSKLWQKYDPFTISMSHHEYEEILAFLKKRAAPLSGSTTNIAALNNSVKRLARIYRKHSGAIKRNLIKDLKLELAGATPSGLLKMFRWVYGMKSRGPIMLERLRTIGFEVDMDIIPCFKVNPYNGRRHAWIFKAHKPSKHIS